MQIGHRNDVRALALRQSKRRNYGPCVDPRGESGASPLVEHSDEKNMNKLVDWKAFVDTYGIKSADLKNKLLFKSFATFRAT